MHKFGFFLLFIIFTFLCEAQKPVIKEVDTTVSTDSIVKIDYLSFLVNGYLPTKYFDFDIKYLLKYNQYEAIRLGLGGTTNAQFSDKTKLGGYVAYGFKDHTYKFSVNAAVRVNEQRNTWFKAAYTSDLQETASTAFIVDGRIFQFFEPRLLNIDLFYHHETLSLGTQHDLSPQLLAEIQFANSYIDPTYNYGYISGNHIYNNYHLSTAKFCLQWSPFSVYDKSYTRPKEAIVGYPKFTLQATKSFSDVLKSDFGFTKLDFRTIFKFQLKELSYTEFVLSSGIAWGDTPLTHLYHAYPNNITKETILQRFTVAGLNSFETMYFNEFFSDKFMTIQGKYYLSPFNFGPRFKPQLVLISRFAIGDMEHPEKHLGIDFNTLEKGYFESGIELNKLLFGFGLSLSYRYGSYHLPHEADNIAFKFTFNITL